MSLFRLILLVVFCIGNSSCSEKSADSSTIKIKFNKEALSLGLQAPPSVKVDASNANGPNWGLEDPTQLSQIDCWGVFVKGPEEKLKGSYCKNPNDTVIANFGVRAGFFQINSEGEVEVPAGENREIFLAGMASVDGTCDPGFDENPDINFSKYSAPFILGKTNPISLVKAVEEVEIVLQNHFSNSNKINDCDFISDDADDGTVDGPYLTFFPTERQHWIQSDTVPRTVQVHHEGSSIQCSSNGGASFTACASNSSLVWNYTNYGNQHVVKINYPDGTSELLNFTPSTQYPGVIFYPCHLTVTAADTQFSAFSTMLATTMQNICFENGVSISDSVGSSLTVAPNNAILSFHGPQPGAQLENTHTTGGLLAYASGATAESLIISGMKLTGNSMTNETIDLLYTPGSGVSGVIIEDSEIFSNADSDAISTGSGGGMLSVFINRSMIHADSASSANGIYVNSNVDVNIDSSIVTSTYKAIQNYYGTATVTNSSLVGIGALSYPMATVGSATSTVSNSIIEDQSGNGFVVDCFSSIETAVANLSGNMFRRADIAGTNSFAIMGFTPGGCTATLNSATNDNLFCHENPTTPIYSGQVGGTISGGSYSQGVQDTNAGGNAISVCP